MPKLPDALWQEYLQFMSVKRKMNKQTKPYTQPDVQTHKTDKRRREHEGSVAPPLDMASY